VNIGLRFRNRYIVALATVIVCYVTVSYLILPATWSRIEHEPGLAKRTFLTANGQGIPGGPINVGLIGTREDVISAFHVAAWYPADPITLQSSLEIIGSVVLDRPYKKAPVSPLFFEGRREDLAFEKPHGASADRRQHVRLWLVLTNGTDASPVWLRRMPTLPEKGRIARHHHLAPHDIAHGGVTCDDADLSSHLALWRQPGRSPDVRGSQVC
jgi:hypothetical protein